MSTFYLIIGLIILIFGGDFVVKSSVALSLKFNLSKLIIGMTVVSFSTSLPELFVSLHAAISGSEDISLSNVIGSNIANILLVLGFTSIISPIVIDKKFYTNWAGMMLLSLVLYIFIQNDLLLSRTEGFLLLFILIIFVINMIWNSKKSEERYKNNQVNENLKGIRYSKIIFWLIAGSIALYFGSKFFIEGAKDIASNLGISDTTIGLSVIAIGTSIPELSTSIISALKGEKEISIGNIIGSNIFNIGSVLGLTSIISPLKINPKILSDDIYWMIGVAFIILPLVILPKTHEITRFKGFILFISYTLFIYLLF